MLTVLVLVCRFGIWHRNRRLYRRFAIHKAGCRIYSPLLYPLGALHSLSIVLRTLVVSVFCSFTRQVQPFAFSLSHITVFFTMHAYAPLVFLLCLVPRLVTAVPIGSTLTIRSMSAATTSVSQDVVTSDLTRPALHSRAVYCSAGSVTALSCGAPCQALQGIKVLTAGGNDGAIPGFYVATDPSIQAIVVAHQGTDPQKLLSIANDVEIEHVAMNATLFPKSAQGVKVHDGFQNTQGRTADLVLSTVKSALSSSGFKNVLTTGHSLGAAVALLDATMLKMLLPSDVTVESVTFGMPRVGNQQFADMIDGLIPGLTRVTNQHDIVPIVPPRVLEYEQVSGEIHITAVNSTSGAATLVACPGQENSHCAEGNSLLDVSIANHLGPYFGGISFGADACPS